MDNVCHFSLLGCHWCTIWWKTIVKLFNGIVFIRKNFRRSASKGEEAGWCHGRQVTHWTFYHDRYCVMLEQSKSKQWHTILYLSQNNDTPFYIYKYMSSPVLKERHGSLIWNFSGRLSWAILGRQCWAQCSKWGTRVSLSAPESTSSGKKTK